MEDESFVHSRTLSSTWLSFSLAFKNATGVCRHIRQAHPEPTAVGHLIQRYLNQQDTELSRILHGFVSEQELAQLFSDTTISNRQRAESWLAAQPNHHVLGLDHPAYPSLLQATDYAPPLLYACGSLEALTHPLLAVVGSRKASHLALGHTRQLCQTLAEHGVGIVSGLALGVDAAAHEGALDAAGNAKTALCGPTIAIAATPANRIYPKRHAPLAQRIVDTGGLILTEYPLDTPTLPWHFPRRNRIISGISLGVVVAEAALPSGSLTTATHAMNQGREVMAMPGSLQNLQAKGCHALIKQGAALIETAEDVIDVLGAPLQRSLDTFRSGHMQSTLTRPEARPTHPQQPLFPVDDLDLSQTELALLDTLSAQCATADELLAHCNLSVPQLAATLGLLETRGLITTTTGGRYARC